jgi:hypothetical protein
MTEIYVRNRVPVYLQPTWKWRVWIFTFCSTLTEGKRQVFMRKWDAGGGDFPIVLHLRGFVWKLTERAEVVILLVVFGWKQGAGRKRENSKNRRVAEGSSFRDCLEKCYKTSPSFRHKIWHAIVVAAVGSTDLRTRLKPHTVSEAEFIFIFRWSKKREHLQLGPLAQSC